MDFNKSTQQKHISMEACFCHRKKKNRLFILQVALFLTIPSLYLTFQSGKKSELWQTRNWEIENSQFWEEKYELWEEKSQLYIFYSLVENYEKQVAIALRNWKKKSEFSVENASSVCITSFKIIILFCSTSSTTSNSKFDERFQVELYIQRIC